MNTCPITNDIAAYCNRHTDNVTCIDTACVPMNLVRLVDLYRPTHVDIAKDDLAAYYYEKLLDEGSVIFVSPEENRTLELVDFEKEVDINISETLKAGTFEANLLQGDDMAKALESTLDEYYRAKVFRSESIKEMAITAIWEAVSDFEEVLEAA